jgi:hypothetical protein
MCVLSFFAGMLVAVVVAVVVIWLITKAMYNDPPGPRL